ncbi:AAA family ATPase, partial [Vibrio anguillarum]
LQMQRLERELPEADIPYQTHTMLQAGIATIADNYDIIIIDGHPDLGMGTMNMICASDVTLIATSTEVNDINSTTQLMALIADIYSDNSMLETTHEPVVRVLPTKLGGV